MLKRFRLIFTATLMMVLAYAALAQRPRSINQETDGSTTKTATPPPVVSAPQTVKAKYEGGVFGHDKKMEGTLSLDDTNNRLVFRDGKKREVISIPYTALTGAYGDTHSVRPAAATVASHVPLYGIPASFIKTKVRYLALQYNDPDSNVAGVTSFRLENKEILDSVLSSLATKAGLSPRGEVFVRKKQAPGP
jgi:hypothetical protein